MEHYSTFREHLTLARSPTRSPLRSAAHLARLVVVAPQVDNLGQPKAGRVLRDQAGCGRVPRHKRRDNSKRARHAEERGAGVVVRQPEEEEELRTRGERGEAVSARATPRERVSGRGLRTKSTRTQKARSPPEERKAQNVKTRPVMNHEKKTAREEAGKWAISAGERWGGITEQGSHCPMASLSWFESV